MLLVIGSAYPYWGSSWSLRPWLAMKVLGLAFDEVRIPLYRPGSKEQILRYSPAGKVPIDHAAKRGDIGRGQVIHSQDDVMGR